MSQVAAGIGSPKLDPQVRSLLEAMPPHPPWSSLAPAAAHAYPTPINAAPEAVFSVSQRSIEGPGGWLALRIYRPSGAGPHPALIYLHGGGFVFGGLETTDRFARAITNLVPCVAISVDYRLSLETKFPGALEDAFAALRWVAGAATELGIDPGRVAVGGSAPARISRRRLRCCRVTEAGLLWPSSSWSRGCSTHAAWPRPIASSMGSS